MKQSTHVLFLLFLSCHTGNNQPKDTFSSDNDFDLSDKASIDSTFRRDVNSYQRAVIDGKVNVAAKYLHPAIYKYFKKEYPEEISTESDFHKLIIKKPYKENFQKLQKKGLEFEFKIEPLSKIVVDEDIIFVVTNTHMITTKGLDKFSTGEKVIGISSDKGKNWQFINISNNIELSRKILETIAPRKVVENLLY